MFSVRTPFFRGHYDPLIHTLFKSTLIVMIIAELATSVATMLDGIIIAHFFDKLQVVGAIDIYRKDGETIK